MGPLASWLRTGTVARAARIHTVNGSVFMAIYSTDEAFMSRRRFLESSALIGAAALAGRLATTAAGAVLPQPPAGAAKRRIRIVMGGYGPPSTGFSLALKKIGDRLDASLGDMVEVKYV